MPNHRIESHGLVNVGYNRKTVTMSDYYQGDNGQWFSFCTYNGAIDNTKESGTDDDV